MPRLLPLPLPLPPHRQEPLLRHVRDLCPSNWRGNGPEEERLARAVTPEEEGRAQGELQRGNRWCSRSALTNWNSKGQVEGLSDALLREGPFLTARQRWLRPAVFPSVPVARVAMMPSGPRRQLELPKHLESRRRERLLTVYSFVPRQTSFFFIFPPQPGRCLPLCPSHTQPPIPLPPNPGMKFEQSLPHSRTGRNSLQKDCRPPPEPRSPHLAVRRRSTPTASWQGRVLPPHSLPGRGGLLPRRTKRQSSGRDRIIVPPFGFGASVLWNPRAYTHPQSSH